MLGEEGIFRGAKVAGERQRTVYDPAFLSLVEESLVELIKRVISQDKTFIEPETPLVTYHFFPLLRKRVRGRQQALEFDSALEAMELKVPSESENSHLRYTPGGALLLGLSYNPKIWGKLRKGRKKSLEFLGNCVSHLLVEKNESWFKIIKVRDFIESCLDNYQNAGIFCDCPVCQKFLKAKTESVKEKP